MILRASGPERELISIEAASTLSPRCKSLLRVSVCADGFLYDGFCTRAIRADAQGTSVLSPGFPVALLSVAAFVIAAKSHAALLELHPTLYCATFSLAFAKLCNQLIVRSSSSLFRSLTSELYTYTYSTSNCAVQRSCVHLWPPHASP